VQFGKKDTTVSKELTASMFGPEDKDCRFLWNTAFWHSTQPHIPEKCNFHDIRVSNRYSHMSGVKLIGTMLQIKNMDRKETPNWNHKTKLVPVNLAVSTTPNYFLSEQ
jgi:hypothetical protein